MINSEPSKISLYIKNDLKQSLKIKAAQDNVSISKVARYFLQNWNLGFAGFVEYKDKSTLPNISGIYFVISDSTVRYIGRSISLKSRFAGSSHHRHEIFKKLNSPVIQWIAVDNSELNELEDILVDIIDPEINEQHSNGECYSKQATMKMWPETLDFLREIKRITKESQAAIFHRLIVAELKRIKADRRIANND